MREQLQQSLQQLKTEYAAGQKMLADLEAQQANLRDTLLRISGAIQVLEEALSETDIPVPPELGAANSTTETAPSFVNS